MVEEVAVQQQLTRQKDELMDSHGQIAGHNGRGRLKREMLLGSSDGDKPAARRSAAGRNGRIKLEREVLLGIDESEWVATARVRHGRSMNISTTGMFIQVRRPPQPGSNLKLEFSLTDQSAIRGAAEVVWVRRDESTPDRPPGMGIRFLDLGAKSLQLIRWWIGNQSLGLGETLPAAPALQEAAAGVREPAAVERPAAPAVDRAAPTVSEVLPAVGPAALAEADPAVEEPEPAPWTCAAPGAAEDPASLRAELQRRSSFAGSAAPDQPERIRIRRHYVHALAVAAACALFLASGLADSLKQFVSGRLAAASATTTAAVPAGPVGDAPSGSGPPDLGAQIADRKLELIGLTQAWADAWSGRWADSYLGFYSPDFRPPGGISRADWEAQRRSRISAARRIEIELSGYDVALLSATHARVSFDQVYRSNRHQDNTRKVLVWHKREGSWSILDERSGIPQTAG